MQNPNFTAENVLLIRLTTEPDQEGYLMPPHAKIRFRPMIPVVYDAEDPSPIGMARLRRVGSTIVMDLTIYATAYDVAHTRRMLAKLTPCAAGIVLKIEGATITGFQIDHVMLSHNGNTDDKIPPLGEKVVPIPDKRAMH